MGDYGSLLIDKSITTEQWKIPIGDRVYYSKYHPALVFIKMAEDFTYRAGWTPREFNESKFLVRKGEFLCIPMLGFQHADKITTYSSYKDIKDSHAIFRKDYSGEYKELVNSMKESREKEEQRLDEEGEKTGKIYPMVFRMTTADNHEVSFSMGGVSRERALDIVRETTVGEMIEAGVFTNLTVNRVL